MDLPKKRLQESMKQNHLRLQQRMNRVNYKLRKSFFTQQNDSKIKIVCKINENN